MFKKQFLVILPIIACSITGCATMFGDNTRRVSVNSTPPGASIFIDGKKRGNTPAVVTLPTYIYGGTNILFKKENYEDITVPVDTSFQLVSLWNILFPLGFIIDIADGNIVKISPESLNVHADLGKKTAAKNTSDVQTKKSDSTKQTH